MSMDTICLSSMTKSDFVDYKGSQKLTEARFGNIHQQSALLMILLPPELRISYYNLNFATRNQAIQRFLSFMQ